MAYDFQALWKEKKHRLLRETRFSIREHNIDSIGKLAADDGGGLPIFRTRQQRAESSTASGG